MLSAHAAGRLDAAYLWREGDAIASHGPARMHGPRAVSNHPAAPSPSHPLPSIDLTNTRQSTMTRKKKVQAVNRDDSGDNTGEAVRMVTSSSSTGPVDLPLSTIEGALARLEYLADAPESFCAPPSDIAEVCIL